jgi:hypothetical protein
MHQSTFSKVAIVIVPIYKPELSELEHISLAQCFKILSNYPIVAVKPKSMSMEQVDYNFNDVLAFDDEYFEDVQGYNRLMLSSHFYKAFLEYEYMLIHQLDAFVFKDELLQWCDKGYDYIGAPWLRYAAYPDIIKEAKNRLRNYLHLNLNLKQPSSGLPTDWQFQNRVGNGGFSLRRTEAMCKICLDDCETIAYYNSREEHYFNEDVFWSLEVNRKRKRLKIPDYKTATHFAIENSYKHGFQITSGKLPFGCHAWDKHLSFWKPIFLQNGVQI